MVFRHSQVSLGKYSSYYRITVCFVCNYATGDRYLIKSGKRDHCS